MHHPTDRIAHTGLIHRTMSERSNHGATSRSLDVKRRSILFGLFVGVFLKINFRCRLKTDAEGSWVRVLCSKTTMRVNTAYLVMFLTICFILLYSLHGYYFLVSARMYKYKPFEYNITEVKLIKQSLTSFDYSPLLSNKSETADLKMSSVTNEPDEWDSCENCSRKRESDDASSSDAAIVTIRSVSTTNQNVSDSVITKRPDVIENGSTPLLVLFSTWPDNMDGQVRNNTCYNWGSLRPRILPVLFASSTSAAGECRKHGWVILPLTPTAARGAPILKFMFAEVMSKFKAPLYGYSNGDILFGDDLLETLSAVSATFTPYTSPLLVVGTRTNVVNVSSRETSSSESLHKAAQKRGKLFINVSQDYFISNTAFPWKRIPEVVVGRVGYDNWLVLDSIHKGYTVVDATNTVLAVHQTTRKGNFQGRSSLYEPKYNIRLLARYHKRIAYRAGSTRCIEIMTKYSENGAINVSKRSKMPQFCKWPYI